jgi:beta-ureidopropionase / N-carbamoyl-L-amino-acid hydrolase
MYKCNQLRLQQSIEKFSQFGATENGGVTRLTLSEQDIAARNYFKQVCEQLGLQVVVDDMANMYAILQGETSDLPIVMGSHIDSVVKGGRFDGILGVLTALEAVQTIIENEIELETPIVIANFTNEEGARFDPAMMSSGVLASKFEKEKMLQSTDVNGITFGQALENSGYEGQIENRLTNALAYLELHIEQGPVLESKGLEIGVVEGVLGMVCYEITINGFSNHAGTTPMPLRKDAMLVATNIIQQLHQSLGQLDDQLVYTFGRMNVLPNIHTVIPNKVTFTLDSRHQSPEIIQKVEEIIKLVAIEQDGCTVEAIKLWGRDTVYFDEAICSQIEQACKDFDYSYMRMYSGAGHDAQFIQTLVPSAMIFVPSINGQSHCEEELTTYEDCAKGADILLETVLMLQSKYSLQKKSTINQ